MASPYGVDWPAWASTTDSAAREQTSKFSRGFRETKSDLKDEMRRLGADQWALEDETGSGGFPGVVRWRRDGNDYAVAADQYTTKSANLREAYLWIKETRKRSDRLVETGADEFAAAQLPSGDEDPQAVVVDEPPHEILGVDPDADEDEIREVFRERAKETHVDQGGSNAEFQRVQEAREALIDG